ncbi:hypothetical protein DACRYDRAFT_15119 [Dacryopinax primogenitus]|uniref:Uncharacterized protein n=1 Tax=Dacryopinax primogenitus (strain DJM 731) TaxID=1858805 RepID=M5GB59_DACPD|nr:uncharacterized protein DACRYDRAFT_15119 [Dacryopinax primogenitus]EJU03252.1 hypothetical protein DACRYDRAFT_15119 [Dacryopinax primogenitus]
MSHLQQADACVDASLTSEAWMGLGGAEGCRDMSEMSVITAFLKSKCNHIHSASDAWAGLRGGDVCRDALNTLCGLEAWMGLGGGKGCRDALDISVGLRVTDTKKLLQLILYKILFMDLLPIHLVFHAFNMAIRAYANWWTIIIDSCEDHFA